MTEGELRELISRSQEDGFRAMFMQFQSYVYAIVWSRIKSVGTKEDAEECVSDVFTDVFLHYDEISEGSLKAYIGTVSKRTAVDMFRKRTSRTAARTASEEELQDLVSEDNVTEAFEQKNQAQILLDLIRSLGEPDATIVIHKYYYDRKSEEIAADVGMQPTAVRVRLSRALKRLRKLLAGTDITL